MQIIGKYRFVSLLIAATIAIAALGEDIIVKRNGDIIKADVKEVTQTEIKYKKVKNPSGPLYTIDKAEVLSINYGNGDKDTFEVPTETQSNVSGAPSTSESVNEISLVPDEMNLTLINSYNAETPRLKNKTPNNKIADDGITYWGVSERSIISTNEFEITFKRKAGYSDKLYDCYEYINNDMVICIKNKTKNTLYIDLANTFQVRHIGKESEGSTWYDSNVYGTSSGSNSGGSLGLGAISSALGIGGTIGSLAGGISVGSGSSNSVNTSYQMDRILAIPPFSSVEMPSHKYVEGKKIYSRYENLSLHSFNLKDNVRTELKKNFRDMPLHKYELMNLAESDTPIKIDYYITISSSPTFSTYSVIPVHLFVRAIFGAMGSTDSVKTDKINVKHPERLILNYIYF